METVRLPLAPGHTSQLLDRIRLRIACIVHNIWVPPIFFHTKDQLAVPVPLALAWSWLVLARVREVAKRTEAAVLAAHRSVHEETWLANTLVVAGFAHGGDWIFFIWDFQGKTVN